MADRNWNVQQCRDWELRILDRVEDLEERIYQGSMYTKVSHSDPYRNSSQSNRSIRVISVSLNQKVTITQTTWSQ